VKAVDRALVDAAIGGTVLIGTLIFGVAKALAKATADSLAAAPKTDVLLPAAAIKTPASLRLTRRVPTTLSKLERERLEALNRLAQQPLRISDAAAITTHVNNVLSSTNSAQLASSVRHLRQAVVEQNDSIFAAGIARTCEAAMRKIGLGQITAGLSSSGTLRVVGSDDSGRTLVSEITMKPGCLPTLETETVNVLDGSCTEIVDRFDRAVEELGLRSGDPKRRVTGGLCQTAGGKALIRAKFAKRLPKPVGQVGGGSKAAPMAQTQHMFAVNGGQK
jgi:hypothetical protein